MEEFLLLIHGNVLNDPSTEALKIHMEAYHKWMMELSENGQYIKGQRLADGGILIDKKAVVVEGPYIESKEIIGGYVLIKANNIKEAAEIAKQCPLSNHLPISVRAMHEIKQ